MIRKVKYRAKAELPYNPDDVNIRLQHFRVFELVKMINEKTLDILNDEDLELMHEEVNQVNLFNEVEQLDIWSDDDLQRNYNLWNPIQKSLFIESLMIKLPIPLFYLDGSHRPWRIVDGLQRLHTIISFIDSNNISHFKLKGLEYLGPECDGKYFIDLPGYLRARIMDAELEAYVINPGTPAEVKYNIFKRINTGGLKLTGQEIRNAFCRGIPADFTKKLASLEAFKDVTNNKVSPRRMDDREYVTRFLAFQIYHYNEYLSKMDIFLTEALMNLYDRSNYELNQLEITFNRACIRIYDVLGDNALYRISNDGALGKRPNKALFDTLSWNFNDLTDNEYDTVKKHKEDFKKEYINFMINDDKLYKAIADTTGTKAAVVNRFERMKHFIKKFTNDQKNRT